LGGTPGETDPPIRRLARNDENRLKFLRRKERGKDQNKTGRLRPAEDGRGGGGSIEGPEKDRPAALGSRPIL